MKQDRRIRYTRAALRDSLIALLKERPVERITVKEICALADINRSTFYVHFASPQELLASIKEEMYDEVASSKGDLTDIHSFIRQMCDVFYAYRAFLSVIIRSVEDMGFLLRISEVWKPDLMQGLKAGGIEGDRAEVIYFYISTGACAVAVAWATGDFQRSSDEMAAEINRLAMEGLGAYIKEE